MGYSCTSAANEVLEKISDVCYKQTKSANSYIKGKNTYMWEIGRENADGAITGTVSKFLPNGYVIKSGTFRIEPNGKITRGLGFSEMLKQWRK